MNYTLYVFLIGFVKIRKYVLWFFKTFDWVMNKFSNGFANIIFGVPMILVCYLVYLTVVNVFV
jgi:hypothetical protein